MTGLDDFNKEVVCRTVKEYYDSGNYPTCENLKEVLEQKIDFSGCARAMGTILTDMGYKYKKGNDGRKVLMERSDIVSAGITFLRKMHNIKKEISSASVEMGNMVIFD